jgi:hypothetical protein
MFWFAQKAVRKPSLVVAGRSCPSLSLRSPLKSISLKKKLSNTLEEEITSSWELRSERDPWRGFPPKCR